MIMLRSKIKMKLRLPQHGRSILRDLVKKSSDLSGLAKAMGERKQQLRRLGPQ